MKRKKSNSYFKLGFFLLGFSLFLCSCQQENEPDFLEDNSTLKSISFSELPSRLTKNIQNLKSGISNNGAKRDESGPILIVDESQIISLVDSLGGVNYSIKIAFEDQSEHILYNLIVGVDNNGLEIDPYIMRYTIDNLSHIDMGDYLDLRRMNATIDIYSFDNFLQYVNNSTSTTNRNDENCPGSMDYSGGGEFEETNDEGGSEDTDDTTGCQVTIFSVGETGDIFAINWHCSNGSSGSFRNEDCPQNNDNDTNTSGSAGINQGTTCPDGMSSDENGICTCITNSHYTSEGCICDNGHVRNLAGLCVNLCDNVETHLNNEAIALKIAELKGNTGLKKETGYKQDKDGNLIAVPNVSGHSLNIGAIRGYKGFMHTHLDPYTDNFGRDITPALMFSPRDVKSFLTMVVSAIQNGHKLEDIYGAMVTSGGTYMLKYAGNPNDIPNVYDMSSLKRSYRNKMSSTENPEDREKAFLKFVRDKMGVKGVFLYKINNSGVREAKKIDESNNLISENC